MERCDKQRFSKPQPVIRPLLCNLLQRILLPAIFHFLVGILLLVRSRRSPLRLRTHNQPSAQQSNKICSGSNDRLGLKTTSELEVRSTTRPYSAIPYLPRKIHVPTLGREDGGH